MNVILLAPILWCAVNWTLPDGHFFPTNKKTVVEEMTAFQDQATSGFLGRVNEPPLSEFTKDADAEVYQMMILPTWGNTILVRVQRHGSVHSISARRLDGQAGFEQGKLVEVKDFELNTEDSKTLKQLLQNLNFFQLSRNDDVRGFDGDEWILEGVHRANTISFNAGERRPTTAISAG